MTKWIADRHRVMTDRASGIVDDPDGWSADLRHIVDLFKRIVTVRIESVTVIDALPGLELL